MEVSSTTTSYGDVVAHFAERSIRASRRLEQWRSSSSKVAEVVPWVESTVTQIAYQVSSTDMLSVAQETQHALGEISKAEAEKVIPIRDWHPSFAFQHVLHHATESLGYVPTYQRFRRFCRDDSKAAAMLLVPARDALSQAVAAGFPAGLARDAIRWRVGNVYYAYLKELYCLAVLRESGLDARYHVLADALFRTDLWVDDLCVSIYVDNRLFKSGFSTGRKPKAEEILGDGPFTFVRLELVTKHEFGTVHLPDPDALTELVLKSTP